MKVSLGFAIAAVLITGLFSNIFSSHSVGMVAGMLVVILGLMVDAPAEKTASTESGETGRPEPKSNAS